MGLPKITVQHLLIRPSLNDAWLSGFTDAEGCFHAAYHTSGTIRGNIYLNFRNEFSICRRGCENKDVIHAIQQLFNVGEMYHYAKDDHWTYRVRAAKDCLLIADYFKTFELGSKF